MRREDSKRRLSIFFLLLLLLLVAVTWFALGWLEDTAKQISERQPEDAPADKPAKEDPTEPIQEAPLVSPPAPTPKPVVDTSMPRTTRSIELKTRKSSKVDDYKDLVAAARMYLDLDEDSWVGRAEIVKALTAWAEVGVYPLADTPILRWVVAQARSFDDRITRKWTQKNGLELVDHERYGFEVGGADRRFHIRLPPSYPKHNRAFDAYPRPGPWPTVFVLPTGQDVASKEGPGASWMQRNWDPKAHADLYQDWCLCMPIAPNGVYSKDEIIDAGSVFRTLRVFWNHYHVDFDQLLVDGGQDALLLTTTNGAPFFAGLILRDLALVDGKIESEKLAASVTNVRHLPIYVPNRPDIAQALEALGCVRVTSGGGGAELTRWMRKQRRHTPTSFEWSIVATDQTLAYWINVDGADWDAQIRQIAVHVSEREPNTIRIQAEGVHELTIFLSDDIVNLDERVRVVINDKVVHDAELVVKEKYAPIHRDLQGIFERKPVEVRRHRYYGWLHAASIVRLPVPGAARQPRKATPRDVANAKRYLDKGQQSLNDGDKVGAIRFAIKGLAFPVNEHTDDLRALLQASR